MEPESPRAGVLRVFRVEPGITVHARTLSDGYSGLYTHWNRGRSIYCQGTDCNPLFHKSDKFWKGYAAVELWNVATKKWNPVVLEISEALELDFRGLWKRGQIWEIYRETQTSKKPTPVMAKLLEEKDATVWPKAFDFKPVLLHLYHVQTLHLGNVNPMPSRVIVTESEGDGPAILNGALGGSEAVDPEVQRKFQEYLNKNKKTPTEKKHAKA